MNAIQENNTSFYEQINRKYSKLTKFGFFRGMARTLDIATILNQYKFEDPDCVDSLAIRSDWEAVGKDIKKAMESFDKEYAEKHKDK
ncbi:MAG: hypothetical protein ACM3WV_11130 [Bacillota bacterium]